MSGEQTRSTIRKFIQDHFMIGRPPDSVTDSDSLLEKGIMDSTGVLELMEFIESSFNIQIGDEEVIPENLGSVDNLVGYVNRKGEIAVTT